MISHIPLPDVSEVTMPPTPLLAAGFPLAWWTIGIVFAVAACVLIYTFLFRQPAGKSSANQQSEQTPVRSAFDDLIAGHKLTPDEVAILRQAATQLELDQPLLLFVDPGLLAKFSDSCPDTDALRRKLFDPVSEEAPQNSESPDTVPQDDACSESATCESETSKPATEAESATSPDTSIDAVAEELLGDLTSVPASRSAELTDAVYAESGN